MAGSLESQLEAADPGEQTRNQHDGRATPGRESSDDDQLKQSIEDLHRACGVYTMPAVVSTILDAVGWRGDADLTCARFLEPAAGGGEFVVQAAERLIGSCRSRGIKPTAQLLGPRITAFELHPRAASDARRRVRTSLQANGVSYTTASACADAWIRTADFLLSETPCTDYTHIVGNPPYIRWSKIPPVLRSRYEARLPRHASRGDLFLPFLDRSFERLQPTGKCGFLCSDRWRYTVFAEGFRQRWLPWLDILSNESVNAADVFSRRVSISPSILVASKRPMKRQNRPSTRNLPGKTLASLQCPIKAGPALGHTPAFVLEPDEHDVELELLRPWVAAPEVRDGSIDWRGRRVVMMFDKSGKLRDLQDYPLLARRLRRFRTELINRSFVQKGAPWYRTIDRTRTVDWLRPKLLVPELAKVPRVALDRSGIVPSHGVYAIFPPDDRIEEIYDALRDGGLAQALEGIAPKLKGYTRCYKRFLSRARLFA